VSYGRAAATTSTRVLARHTTHPRQSRNRGAEHAGRGLAARHQFPL
jgi:hypothetical protein